MGLMGSGRPLNLWRWDIYLQNLLNTWRIKALPFFLYLFFFQSSTHFIWMVPMSMWNRRDSHENQTLTTILIRRALGCLYLNKCTLHVFCGAFTWCFVILSMPHAHGFYLLHRSLFQQTRLLLVKWHVARWRLTDHEIQDMVRNLSFITINHQLREFSWAINLIQLKTRPAFLKPDLAGHCNGYVQSHFKSNRLIGFCLHFFGFIQGWIRSNPTVQPVSTKLSSAWFSFSGIF